MDQASHVKPVAALLRGPVAWGRRVPPLSQMALPFAHDEHAAGESCLSALARLDRADDPLLIRARSAIDRLVAAQVGGDCFAPQAPGLVADQTALLVIGHDVQSGLARADLASLRCVYDRADAERGDATVVLVAPDARSPAARARMEEIARSRGWRYVAGAVDPWSLLEQIAQVFTIGHEIGFIALLRGIRVRCFGRAFYAGWGVTEDDPTVLPRGLSRSVEQIFAATSILGAAYRDPFSGEDCAIEDIIDILADWRRIDRANRALGACLGVSIWKQNRLRDLLRSTHGAPAFPVRTRTAVALAKTGDRTVAVWATREKPGLAESGAPIARIEDGFIRSVGLGADFMPGASIVIDRKGIYFDPTRPSDLDEILEETAFAPRIIERARRLIHLMISRGITKYNTGSDAPALDAPEGRTRILAPGQVENDRSVVLGGAGITRNLDLLKRIRSENPSAFIVYKPHPDVDAGYRPGAIPDAEALRWADRVVRGVSCASLIASVDEVHTLTSLAGFEALIRGRTVVAYGQPFYAGWGLTRDLAPIAHRNRRLSLEELVAGVLILYPRYIDPVTRLPCGPELLIERLADPDCWRAGPLVTLRRLQGALTRRWLDRRGRDGVLPIARTEGQGA